MFAYRKSALLIGLLLVAPTAQAQTITKQGEAQFQMKAPAQARPATVLDYVLPYIPLVGQRSREMPQAKSLTQAAPVPPAQTAPQPRKKKPVSKTRTAKAKPAKIAKVQKPKRAVPQPAAATLSVPQDEPSPATVDALTQCLASFAAREVSRGSQASADHLMAEAADQDCGVEFRSLAQAVSGSGDKAKARQMVEVLIRETLSPAVETAMAEATTVPQ